MEFIWQDKMLSIKTAILVNEIALRFITGYVAAILPEGMSYLIEAEWRLYASVI